MRGDKYPLLESMPSEAASRQSVGETALLIFMYEDRELDDGM